jgi:hypothetical protein
MLIRELKNKYSDDFKKSGVLPAQYLEAINIIFLKELNEKMDKLIDILTPKEEVKEEEKKTNTNKKTSSTK